LSLVMFPWRDLSSSFFFYPPVKGNPWSLRLLAVRIVPPSRLRIRGRSFSLLRDYHGAQIPYSPPPPGTCPCGVVLKKSPPLGKPAEKISTFRALAIKTYFFFLIPPLWEPYFFFSVVGASLQAPEPTLSTSPDDKSQSTHFFSFPLPPLPRPKG